MTIRAEQAIEVRGVPARAFAVHAWPEGSGRHAGRLSNQTIKTEAREYMEGKTRCRIRAELRFDDNCKNGHESFAITATVDALERGAWREYMGGCCRDEIAKHFPELAPLIKWHLTSTDGPMHYIANAVYFAGDRDHNGRRKGEPSSWEYGVRFGDSPVTHRIEKRFWAFLKARHGTGQFIRSEATHEREPKTYGTHYSVQGFGETWHEMPFRDQTEADEFILALNTCRAEFVEIVTGYSEGKARELDHARSAAVWPEATDAELSQEPAQLKAALEARLPQLLADFKAAMLGAGFIWPKD